MPALVITYLYFVLVDVIGASQGFAFLGILREVVVCVPLTNTHSIVSPRLMVSEEGVKTKLATVTTCLVAFDFNNVAGTSKPTRRKVCKNRV